MLDRLRGCFRYIVAVALPLAGAVLAVVRFADGDRDEALRSRAAVAAAACCAVRAAARLALAAASPRRSRACRRASGRGAHQLRSPSSFISAGTSSARTIVASIRTATAAPTPSCLMKTICDVANAPSATTSSSAAAVTMRPVRWRPSATASSFVAPASRASLMRVSRKTP